MGTLCSISRTIALEIQPTKLFYHSNHCIDEKDNYINSNNDKKYLKNLNKHKPESPKSWPGNHIHLDISCLVECNYGEWKNSRWAENIKIIKDIILHLEIKFKNM